uniref:High affinity immunoglobulin epsilon receptor subunit gamma n=1 Tax=Neogobius melanostomus TaxID=47308 RepID=A0A8C6UI43_9GOBI
MGRPSALAIALPLWMCFGRAAASLHEPEVCYILDGVLFLYGLMLTTLYCRLKITSIKNAQAGKKQKKGAADEPIYTGLTQPADTYETIGLKTST